MAVGYVFWSLDFPLVACRNISILLLKEVVQVFTDDHVLKRAHGCLLVLLFGLYIF